MKQGDLVRQKGKVPLHADPPPIMTVREVPYVHLAPECVQFALCEWIEQRLFGCVIRIQQFPVEQLEVVP